MLIDGTRTLIFRALAGGLCAALFWLPFADTALFQDDLGFLYIARQQIASRSWSAWLTQTSGQSTFWRPLSVGLHWLFSATALGGSPWSLHLWNLLVLALASAIAGLVAVRVVASSSWEVKHTSPSAFWSAFLFGIHGCWLLPAVWACAVQETYAILFSGLALLSWAAVLSFSSLPGFRTWVSGILCIIFYAAALMSKEGSIVLPFLAWIVIRPKAMGLMAINSVTSTIVCIFVVTGAWIGFHTHLTYVPDDSPYAPALGLNVVRNAGLLISFLCNLPREAITVWLVSRSGWVLTWGIGCCALQMFAIIGMIRSVVPWHVLRTKVSLWILIALLPYFFLKSQCYPYYACMALLAYPWLIAKAWTQDRRRFYMFAGAAIGSSVVLTIGEGLLPAPAPLARANWSKYALEDLALQRSRLPGKLDSLPVAIKSDSHFAAGGYFAGPAMALRLDIRVFREADDVTTLAIPRLEVDRPGYHLITETLP
jgi:hypothetical protein